MIITIAIISTILGFYFTIGYIRFRNQKNRVNGTINSVIELNETTQKFGNGDPSVRVLNEKVIKLEERYKGA